MKLKPGSIVVGVDGSESATHALDWAIDQAAAERRTITLVHAVAAVSPQWMDQAVADPREASEVLRAEAQAVLDGARAQVEARAPGLDVGEVLRLEDPREVLQELSEHAAMIVIGSHGRGRVRRLLLGSVGVALARTAHCPIVVHRPTNPGVVRRGVAVGADGSEESLTVLEFAYHQASLQGVPLTVVHCFWDVQASVTPTHVVLDTDVEELDEERLLLAETMAGLGEKYPDVHVEVELARGLPEHAMVNHGDHMNLLVVGAHQGSRLQQLLYGSVSVAVLEHARCPVAVVPVAGD